MSSKDYVTSCLILVVLLIGIAALNIYVIKPALTPKFSVTVAPSVRAPVQSNRFARTSAKRTAANNIVATTLEKMKSMFPEKEYSKDFEPRQVTRNPFFWPYEATTEEQMRDEYQAALGETEEAAERGTRLRMVILGENRKIALINNQILFEGSMYGADTVKNIYEKEVVLSGPSGETRLMMARALPTQHTMPVPGSKKDKQKIQPAHEESVESLINKLKPFLEKGQQKELEKVIETQK